MLLSPLAFVGYYIAHHSEFYKPILHFLGDVAVVLLVGVIILGMITKIKNKYQKFLAILGQYVLFYASLHLAIYLVSEIFWQDFFVEVSKRSYLLLGFIAFLLIAWLDFLSFFSKKIFHRYAGLSYVAGLLAGMHFLLGQKIPSWFSYVIFAIFLALICYKLTKKDKK